VSYAPSNVYDGDSKTAWRCDGTGVGHVLTFAFPAGTSLGEVGLINGYAKTDPSTGSDRYPEYRRITRVTWTFADRHSVTQSLQDGNRGLQLTAVGPHPAGQVTLRIDATTKPGSSDSSRNAVLISEVGFR